MANLILKPSTGGVLKIQNDAGTVDALSVSTGGNLTAAGTLGVTGATTLTGGVAGNTTFADNTTLSGTLGVTGNTTLSGTANNVGTVTAGSIAGGAITSATTFPAGHIVSFDAGYYSGTDLGKNDTNFTEANSAMRVTITPTSPNKILLVCQGGIPHSGTSGHIMRCSWGIVGGSMNLADSSQGLETYTDNYKNGGHSYSILVTPGSYGSAITYTPTYTTTSGTSYFTEGGAGQNITTYAMEIKQ